jgi:hypothetical protein
VAIRNINDKIRSYLNTVPTIDLRDTLIIFPYNTELQYTLWDLHNLKSLLVTRVGFQEKPQASGQFFKSLLRKNKNFVRLVTDKWVKKIPARILVQLEEPWYTESNEMEMGVGLRVGPFVALVIGKFGPRRLQFRDVIMN